MSSCKKERSGITKKTIDAQPKTFAVTLDVQFSKDENLSLFYTEDGSIDFKGDPIWKNATGGSSPQQITFELPEDVFPTELRIDFGSKNIDADIVLKSITLSYNGNERIISGAEIGNFFRPDENKCTFDPSTGKLTGVMKDGVLQNPSLYPQEKALMPEIEKLAR